MHLTVVLVGTALCSVLVLRIHLLIYWDLVRQLCTVSVTVSYGEISELLT